MSPLPDPDRLREYAVKGAHLALRQLAQAPEQRTARRLASEAPTAEPGGPRVLVMTMRDWSAHVAWEAMIAQALRLRGADVTFLTCGGDLDICDRVNVYEGPPVPCRTCRKYVNDSVAAHGFSYRTVREGWLSDDHAAWPELDELSVPELSAVVDPDSGLPLGQLVSIPVRWFLMRAELDDDPLGALTYRRFLRSARRVARGITEALDQAEPDVVFMLNGLFFFESIAWALCKDRGIRVVTYERSFIKETILVRREASAALGDVSAAWARWKDTPLTSAEDAELDEYLRDRELGRRTIDRFWIDPTFDKTSRRTGGRLATLFTNLTWDSAVIDQDVAFPSIQAWISAAIAAFAARPEHELIVRIHPAEVKLPGKQTREPLAAFINDAWPSLPPNVRLITADDPQSSYPLMEASDLGLVFTSTTGLELALRGVPVLVAGRTHYRGKGFTVDLTSESEFTERLDDVLADPESFVPDRDAARRYAYLFFFREPVASPGVVEHVPGLARITSLSLAELGRQNDDVERIASEILAGLPGYR